MLIEESLIYIYAFIYIVSLIIESFFSSFL